MIDQIKNHIKEAQAFTSDQLEEVEAFRIQYLGKKGILNSFFAQFKSIPKEQKKSLVKPSIS